MAGRAMSSSLPGLLVGKLIVSAGLFGARYVPADGLALCFANQVIYMQPGAMRDVRLLARIAIFKAGSVCRTLA